MATKNNNYSNNNNNANSGEQKITSGAKKCASKDGDFCVSAWKKMGPNFLTFFFNLNAKHAKKVTGKNDKKYISSVPVKILNKNTLQESWTWGIWNVNSNTLSMDKIGLYISLQKGGFVGRIKA